ncbi:hypothetical protein P8452_61425 [Trifolium repens]|nr:hypothetical protein P8452_61425 [Trifolium repens]
MDHYNSAQQSPVHFLEKLEAKQINNNASTFLGKARSMHVLSLSFSVTQQNPPTSFKTHGDLSSSCCPISHITVSS